MTRRGAWKPAADKVIRELGCVDKLRESTVLLVGSAARGAATAASDIDMLVIAPRELPRLDVDPNVQLFTMTRKQFLNRLKAGDDFSHWAVRFAKVLSDMPGWWDRALHDPAAASWPDWRRKFKQAAARLSFASKLLALRDYDHAREEYLLSARHFARGALLMRGVFPLSQPELPGQLRQAGCAELARLLDILVSATVDRTVLARADRSLTRWLGPAAYHEERQDLGVRGS